MKGKGEMGSSTRKLSLARVSLLLEAAYSSFHWQNEHWLRDVVPNKDVVFKFPSGYESTELGSEKMWDDLMPC
jgi:hypothetical protein